MGITEPMGPGSESSSSPVRFFSAGCNEQAEDLQEWSEGYGNEWS